MLLDRSSTEPSGVMVRPVDGINDGDTGDGGVDGNTSDVGVVSNSERNSIPYDPSMPTTAADAPKSSRSSSMLWLLSSCRSAISSTITRRQTRFGSTFAIASGRCAVVLVVAALVAVLVSEILSSS